MQCLFYFECGYVANKYSSKCKYWVLVSLLLYMISVVISITDIYSIVKCKNVWWSWPSSHLKRKVKIFRFVGAGGKMIEHIFFKSKLYILFWDIIDNIFSRDFKPTAQYSYERIGCKISSFLWKVKIKYIISKQLYSLHKINNLFSSMVMQEKKFSIAGHKCTHPFFFLGKNFLPEFPLPC